MRPSLLAVPAWPRIGPVDTAKVAATAGPAASILAVQLIFFPLPLGVFIRGIIIGLLGALTALGLALIYRSNRIINFSQSELGGFPTALAVLLFAFSGVSYFVSLAAGVGAAVLTGALVEMVFIRRFFKASRLVLTVATVGVATLLGACALLLPRLWGEKAQAHRIGVPWDIEFEISPIVLSGDDILALIVAPLTILALSLFLRTTNVGIGVRASAESADRASLIGIPVKRLQTVVWVVAALLSFVGAFLRAGIIGLPIGSALGFGLLLRSLAAVILGRLTNLPAIAFSAIALGILEVAVGWNASSPLLIDPILALVILMALVLRRRGTTRAEQDDTSSWQAVEEVRPVPPEMKRLPEVRAIQWGGTAVLIIVALGLPLWMGADETLKAAALGIFAIIGVSLIVLTGWSGQVSLGHMGFVGIGAALGAVFTGEWGLDLSLALVAAGAVGAVIAVIVGLPALRFRGLFLAATTFGFALAMSSFFLNRRFFDWIPTDRVERKPIFGAIDYDSPTGIYYLVLFLFVLVVIGVRGIRASRTGRVLIAIRENEQASQAFGVSVTRAKLTAFALSGFIAAFAGALFVHHQQAFGPNSFVPQASFQVFVMVVIGGLGSIPGALLGALYIQGSTWFLSSTGRILASALGVLAILMITPSGLSGLLYRMRDFGLRSIATRRNMIVPSLLADRAEPEPQLEDATGSGAAAARRKPRPEERDHDADEDDETEEDEEVSIA